MTRPSRRTRFIPLPDSEFSSGVVDGDDIDWPTGSLDDSGAIDRWKQPVVAATTADITIATALNDGDTLDGVTLATGDRVLVKDQTAAYENGIIIVGATPARAPDMDIGGEVLGAAVYVIGGTTNAGTTWAVSNTAATVVDTDAIDWAAFGGGSSSEILDIPTAETDASLVLAPDGAGGVEFRAETGGAEPTADAHIADTTDAHDASAVSVGDSGGYFSASDVEGVLQEIGAGSSTSGPSASRVYIYTNFR